MFRCASNHVHPNSCSKCVAQRPRFFLQKKPTDQETAGYEENVLKGFEKLVGEGKFAVGDTLTLADIALFAYLTLPIEVRLCLCLGCVFIAALIMLLFLQARPTPIPLSQSKSNRRSRRKLNHCVCPRKMRQRETSNAHSGVLFLLKRSFLCLPGGVQCHYITYRRRANLNNVFPKTIVMIMISDGPLSASRKSASLGLNQTWVTRDIEPTSIRFRLSDAVEAV